MNWNLLLLGFCLAHVAPLFAAAPAPTDVSAPAPQVKYRSAFEGYRTFREEPLADWRSVNDEVAQAGGHIGIMRGAADSAAPPKPVSGRPPSKSAPEAPAGSPRH